MCNAVQSSTWGLYCAWEGMNTSIDVCMYPGPHLCLQGGNLRHVALSLSVRDYAYW